MLKYLFFAIFFIFSAMAEVNKNSEVLNEINNYLNNIKYFSANFIQINETAKSMSEGKFFLSRPGKMKLEYTNPFSAEIYTNNSVTVYYDKDLEEASHIPTSSTPIEFLVRKNIDIFSEEFTIKNIEITDKEYIISLIEKKKEDQGELFLIFEKNSMELSGISVINANKENIGVRFFNTSNNKIDKNIFKFKNPKLYK